MSSPRFCPSPAAFIAPLTRYKVTGGPGDRSEEHKRRARGCHAGAVLSEEPVAGRASCPQSGKYFQGMKRKGEEGAGFCLSGHREAVR